MQSVFTQNPRFATLACFVSRFDLERPVNPSFFSLQRVTCYEIHCGSGKTLLINRDFESEAPVYHICYPVTLTSFLSETVRVSNMTNTFTLTCNQSADLSLHVAGGPLAHICLSLDGKETESQILFCPGYGMSEESPASLTVSETVSMVPEPGSSNILKFSYPASERQTDVVLLSDLTSYRALKVFLSPELTLKNATTKPAIFSVGFQAFLNNSLLHFSE